MKKLSVILIVKDQGDTLRDTLPQLLSQPCEGGHEVIVVDEHSTDNTGELLEMLKEQHDNLYTTFVPQYHFQRDPRRLAFTIGLKAAKGEWVVCSDIASLPPSETWLTELADSCTPSTTVLLGYVTKNGDVQLKAYEDLSQARQVISRAEHRRQQEKGGWTTFMHHDYNFIVVRREQGHDILRFFETTRMKRL